MATEQQLRYLIEVQDRDLKTLRSELKATNKEMADGVDQASSKGSAGFHKVNKAATLAAFGIAGTALVLGKKFVGAAQEAEKSEQGVRTTLHALGIDYNKHAKQIDSVIQRTSKLAALDDEDLAESFRRLVPSAGNVKEALKQMGLAADLARNRNISLEAATKQVALANAGGTKILKQFGIAMQPVTKNTDEIKRRIDDWKTSHKKLTPAMKDTFDALLRDAKAKDKAIMKTQILSKVTHLVKGSAEDYGKTSAAAGERASVAFENVEEALGKGLLPVIGDLANRLADVLGWVEKHQRATKILIGIILGLAAGVIAVNAGLKVYRAAVVAAQAAQWLWNAAMTANPIGLIIAALVVLGAGLVVAYKKSETFRDVVKGALDIVKTAIDKVVTVVKWISDHVDEAWAVAKWTPPGLIIREFKFLLDHVGDAVKWIIDHAAEAWAIAKWTPAGLLVQGFLKVLTGVKDTVGWIIDHAGDAWRAGKWAVNSGPIKVLRDIIGDIYGFLKWIVDHATIAVKITVHDPGGIFGKLKDAGGFVVGLPEELGKATPRRAGGGSARPFTSYLIGERGPEILTMGGQGGTVTPNNRIIGGSSGDTLYLTTGDVYGDGGIDALADKLVTALAKRGRRNVDIFAGRA